LTPERRTGAHTATSPSVSVLLAKPLTARRGCISGLGELVVAPIPGELRVYGGLVLAVCDDVDCARTARWGAVWRRRHPTKLQVARSSCGHDVNEHDYQVVCAQAQRLLHRSARVTEPEKVLGAALGAALGAPRIFHLGAAPRCGPRCGPRCSLGAHSSVGPRCLQRMRCRNWSTNCAAK
jgi:hypothetical protein